MAMESSTELPSQMAVASATPAPPTTQTGDGEVSKASKDKTGGSMTDSSSTLHPWMPELTSLCSKTIDGDSPGSHGNHLSPSLQA